MTFLGAKTWGNGYIQGTDFESYSYLSISQKLLISSSNIVYSFRGPQWHNQRYNGDKLLIPEWQKLKTVINLIPLMVLMKMVSIKRVITILSQTSVIVESLWNMNDKSSLSSALYLSIGNGGGYGWRGNTRHLDVWDQYGKPVY
jgi:hypothetical protein